MISRMVTSSLVWPATSAGKQLALRLEAFSLRHLTRRDAGLRSLQPVFLKLKRDSQAVRHTLVLSHYPRKPFQKKDRPMLAAPDFHLGHFQNCLHPPPPQLRGTEPESSNAIFNSPKGIRETNFETRFALPFRHRPGGRPTSTLFACGYQTAAMHACTLIPSSPHCWTLAKRPLPGRKA